MTATPPVSESIAPDGDALYQDTVSIIHSIARRMLTSDAEAADVTQTVLARAMQKLAAFRGNAARATWLYRETVDAVLALRRKQTEAANPQAGEATRTTLAEAVGRVQRACRPERWDTRAVTERAIARLPKAYRDPYVLAEVEGLSEQAVAEALGLTRPAVDRRLSRARRLVRSTLATRHAIVPT